MYAATVPGTAAVMYEGVKMNKYSDQPNFVPFIVETGGRVGVAGRRFLDTLIGRLASEEAAEPAQRTAPLGCVSVRPCGRRVVSGQAAGLHAGTDRGRAQRAGPRGGGAGGRVRRRRVWALASRRIPVVYATTGLALLGHFMRGCIK